MKSLTGEVAFLFNDASMREQLHEFCLINSGTTNLKGLAHMHDALAHAFAPIADVVESLVMPSVTTILMNGQTSINEIGKLLWIRKRPELKRRVMLCGHMDTVYDATHPFQTLTALGHNILNGPGVTDMKGGLVVMLHALHAFESTSAAHALGWDVVINADEEMGSTGSMHKMLEIASHCQAALIYEPTLTPEGALAKNRKGNIKVTLVVKGRAAHAGRDFSSGRNAICYLAQLITAIDQLNDQRKDITFNVGKISGGTALNVVPDMAVAKIDIRTALPEDSLWVKQQLDTIQMQLSKVDYTLSINCSFDRPPKRITPTTERLFSHVFAIAKSQNLPIQWEDSGGCCDGNNLAERGLPVIDSLGVRGAHIHTPDEYILLDSLVERAALSTQLLLDLATDGLENLYRERTI